MSEHVSDSPAVPGTSAVRAGNWTLAADRSTAAIAVRNFGFKTVRGTVPFRSATVTVDQHGQIASAQARLDLSAIATGNQRRDQDLSKPRLLNTVDHPTLEFVSTRVTTAESGWRAEGALQARGTSTAVAVDVAVVAGVGIGPLSVRATTRFDRRALGVKAPRFMIGSWIEVQIDAVFELAMQASHS